MGSVSIFNAADGLNQKPVTFLVKMSEYYVTCMVDWHLL